MKYEDTKPKLRAQHENLDGLSGPQVRKGTLKDQLEVSVTTSGTENVESAHTYSLSDEYLTVAPYRIVLERAKLPDPPDQELTAEQWNEAIKEMKLALNKISLDKTRHASEIQGALITLDYCVRNAYNDNTLGCLGCLQLTYNHLMRARLIGESMRKELAGAGIIDGPQKKQMRDLRKVMDNIEGAIDCTMRYLLTGGSEDLDTAWGFLKSGMKGAAQAKRRSVA